MKKIGLQSYMDEGQLTRMLSIPLNTEETDSISFSLWALDDTSQTEPETTNPLSSQAFKHPLSSASFREQVCTLAPSLASSSTIAYLNKIKKILILDYLIQTLWSGTWREREREREEPDSFGSTSYKSAHSLKWPSVICQTHCFPKTLPSLTEIISKETNWFNDDI